MSAHPPTSTVPSVQRRARVVVLAGALVLVGALAGCGNTLDGAAPTTTGAPRSTEDMCTVGHNAFARIGELDRRNAPEYLAKVKEAVEPLPNRAPTAIVEDLRAWVNYVKGATDISQLANLPADLKVSTGRIDVWWKQNCGKPLIGA